VAAQPPRFIREPPPPGIVYNTSMTSPDAALALAALWAYERRRRARVGGVCVTGGGFNAAVFCDLVSQFYRPGERHGNDALAVGLADADELPADEPMVTVPVARTDAAGAPLYARTIERVSDTSLAESQLRNSITFNAESTIVLSAPATSLARSLEIVANRDLYSEPVRELVIVESPRLHADPAALEFLLENWPTAILVLEAAATSNLSLSSSALDQAFAWAEAHPVADAYRAYRSEPYEVPVADLVAMMFAVEKMLPQFMRSEPGTYSVADGSLRYHPEAAGRANRLNPVAIIGLEDALVAAAAANPN
jgi:hypothetical protein